jgi:hypothetical protein
LWQQAIEPNAVELPTIAVTDPFVGCGFVGLQSKIEFPVRAVLSMYSFPQGACQSTQATKQCHWSFASIVYQ